METMGAVNKCHSAVLTNHWTSGTWCHRGSAAAQRWSPSPPVLPPNQAFESPLPEKTRNTLSLKGVGGQQTVGCVCVSVSSTTSVSAPAKTVRLTQPPPPHKKERCVTVQGSNLHPAEHNETASVCTEKVVSVYFKVFVLFSTRLLYCQSKNICNIRILIVQSSNK